MKNLRGFKADEKEQNGGNAGAQNPQDILNAYGNMSEDALFEKLMSEVSASKSNGTFSPEQLMSAVENMKPYLSDAQRTRIEHLIRLIASN